MNYVCSVSNILKAIFSPSIPCHLCEVCFHCWLLCLRLALGLYKHSQLLMKYSDRCHTFSSRRLGMPRVFSKENTSCQHIHRGGTHRFNTCVLFRLCRYTFLRFLIQFSCFYYVCVCVCRSFMCVGWANVLETPSGLAPDTSAFKDKHKVKVRQF